MSISEKEIKEIEKPKELKTKNGIPYKIISHEEGLNRVANRKITDKEIKYFS